jgi:hypothetical protein
VRERRATATVSLVESGLFSLKRVIAAVRRRKKLEDEHAKERRRRRAERSRKEALKALQVVVVGCGDGAAASSACW